MLSSWRLRGFNARSASPLRFRALALLAATTLALSPALAPVVAAASTLTLTTPYPAVLVGPGTKVSFDLSVSASPAARVDLAVAGVPAGWTATLHGGGFVVDAAQTDGKTATSLRLDVDVPDSANGTSTIDVTATGLGQTVTLPLTIRVNAQAAGDVTLQTDVPSQKGASDASFTFSLNLTNNTSQDLTFSATTQAPNGWTATASLTGQATAASAVVKAGSNSTISVSVKPPSDVPAGPYQTVVNVTVGSKQLQQQLEVDIIGSYTMTMTTPNQLLSTTGSVGGGTDQQLILTNTGTAPITNVKVSASVPTNWKATFDTPTIASLAPGQPVTVTATITPSGDAIAGDYQLTFNANGTEASATQDIRFTVQTSLQWAIVGVVLILLVVGGVWWVFQRYGRR